MLLEIHSPKLKHKGIYIIMLVQDQHCEEKNVILCYIVIQYYKYIIKLALLLAEFR